MMRLPTASSYLQSMLPGSQDRFGFVAYLYHLYQVAVPLSGRSQYREVSGDAEKKSV